MYYLEYLNNPIILGIVIGIIVTIFAYIDKRMNDREFENNYYIKLFLFTAVIVSIIMYITKTYIPTRIIKQGGGGNITSSISDIVAHTDIPDF